MDQPFIIHHPQTPAGLRDRVAEAAQRSPDTETALDYLAGLYLEAKSLIDALAAIQEDIKIEIAGIMAETGQMEATTSAANVKIAAPSTRRAYDLDGLAKLRQSNPAAEAMLAPYYRETISGGGLRITGRKR